MKWAVIGWAIGFGLMTLGWLFVLPLFNADDPPWGYGIFYIFGAIQAFTQSLGHHD